MRSPQDGFNAGFGIQLQGISLSNQRSSPAVTQEKTLANHGKII
jgi:hypothetical protein